MKRSVFIGCLLCLSLTVRGVEHTGHNFNTATSATLTLSGGNKVGTMVADGTVYTCMGATGTFASVPAQGGICISLQRLDSVVVSFANDGLRYFNITHGSYTGTMSIFVSSNGTSWTSTEIAGSSTATTTVIENLNGQHYIKIKNTSSANNILYIKYIDYWTEPQNCNCFPYVPE